MVTMEFLMTSLIIVASPGTGVVFTLAAALTRGGRASLIAAFGCTLGIVPHMIAAMTGLAALLHASATAFEIVKVLGVVYLFYMAWTMLHRSGPLTIEPSPGCTQEPGSAMSVITAGILVNLLNPKLSIFFVGFLPLFIRVDNPAPVATMATLSAVFMAMTFAVFAGYGLTAALVRRHIVSRPAALAWIQRGFAAAFVGLGCRLALAER